ncbi:hypothetical protein SAMN02787144_1016107 [Streptomyces atratus]|uniref:Uncharacterized protein n=1 Tax=Streptomyces atratus TaxID=1893 RepID=A0A1K2E0P4_STRAR|nr:hypothetical protein SAMN02787144_1016107 [Streptomyces atratus]
MESRLISYKEFISAYDEFTSITAPLIYVTDGPQRELFSEDVESSAGEALERLKAAYLDVSLAGPEKCLG